MKKILLVGNPNVGKSVIFSRLTGVKVIVANYPGSTVEYTSGFAKIEGQEYKIIDVPGTYSLDATNDAEKIAVQIIKEVSSSSENVIVNIIDSTNFERNLSLTLQLIKNKLSLVIALNFWDETKHKGIDINHERLSEILGVPVVPTVAIGGEGIKQLVDSIKSARGGLVNYDTAADKWNLVGKITSEVQTLTHHHHTILERLEDITLHPITGLPVAAGILAVVFSLIRFIGEGAINTIGNPLFNTIWTPVVMKLSYLLGGKGGLHDVIIGRLIDGQISYGESLGLLTTGLYVPLVAVLPYVLAFYIALSFLEDIGYLPRLSVLVDNIMHRLGIHGYSIIPFMLGFGCNVPGVLSSRIMETRRERFITATLMAITIPCMAQTAMIIGLLGKYGIRGIGTVFLTLFCVWFILGLILNKLIKGKAPALFIEIPPYRLPYFNGLLKKIWMRIAWFMREALPWVLFGVLLINFMYLLDIMDFLEKLTRPVITGLIGLPSGAVGALVVGFLRKDVAVGMLVPLNLTLKQLIIASVILTMYFPCVATAAVLLKEFGIKDTIKAACIMISSTLITGSILNLVL